MKNKKIFSIRFSTIMIYLLLFIGLNFTLLPFLWMIFTSFKTSNEIIRIPPTFFPEKFTFQSYLTIFNDKSLPLIRFYINSLFVASNRVILSLFTSSLAGYIFAKFIFLGRKILFSLVLATLMIPFPVIMIPVYLILFKLHLINTLWGLIVPSIADAFGIFLMRQFIDYIPTEMIEAARIDGSSEFNIYLQILLPQIKSALSALGIFVFMATWNDYLWPLIVITNNIKRTLPLILTWYSNQHVSRYDLSMAASILVLLPVFIVYVLFQKNIIKGMTLTGFK